MITKDLKFHDWKLSISQLCSFILKTLETQKWQNGNNRQKEPNKRRRKERRARKKQLTELKLLGFLFIFQEQWSKTAYSFFKIKKVKCRESLSVIIPYFFSCFPSKLVILQIVSTTLNSLKLASNRKIKNSVWKHLL